jgi:hypothetical protein
MLDARYSILDAGEILDDFIPTCRLEGDVFCREYWSERSGDPENSGILDTQ